MIGASIGTGAALMRQSWLLAAVVLVFAAILVQFSLKIHHSESTRSAFLRWRTQLAELDDGVNVWEKYAYPNPPIMAILLKPFLQLPPALGSTLWFLVKATLTISAIVGVWTLLDTPDRPFPPWGKALSVLLTVRPIEGDLVHGNVNLLILFLIVASLLAFCHRHDALAGFLLGMSIACKLTPILFVAYFLYKRAWKTVFGATAGILVFGLIIPAAFFGWSSNVDYLRSWHAQMVAPYAAGVVSSEHKNQSLPGLLHRLLGDEASFSDYVGDQKVVLETHNIVSWDGGSIHGLIIGSMALFAFLAASFCRASMDERPPLQLMAEFSVVVLGMLLFCERTWKHHCVTLLLPFVVIAYCLSTSLFARGMRWYLAITVGLAALLMLSTSTGVLDRHLDAPDRLGKLSQVYGAYVWAFLLLLASMFVVLRKTRSSQS